MEISPQHIDNSTRALLHDALWNARSSEGISVEKRRILIPEDLRCGLSLKSVTVEPAQDTRATFCIVEHQTDHRFIHDVRAYIIFDDSSRPLKYAESLIPSTDALRAVENETPRIRHAWSQALDRAASEGVIDKQAELERFQQVLRDKGEIIAEYSALHAQLEATTSSEDIRELSKLIEQRLIALRAVTEADPGPLVNYRINSDLAEGYMTSYEDLLRHTEVLSRLEGRAEHLATQHVTYIRRLLESGNGFYLSYREAHELITTLEKCATF